MKKLLLLITLFHSITLAGQSYFNETSQWKQYTYYGGFSSITMEDLLIRLDGDTLIGGTLYYKVLKTGMRYVILNEGGDTVQHLSYHVFLDPIREENQFVYAYDQSGGKEYLVYDFSAEVGETVQAGTCQNYPVTSIDTVFLGNTPRRRFHFLPSPEPTLIEGIGSTESYFEQVCMGFPTPWSNIQCYSQDGDFIQFDVLAFFPNFDCSSLVVADERIEKNIFSIAPNPFDDEIQIHFLGELSQAATISIVNLMGTVMYEKVIQLPGPVEQLDVPYLPAGIYVVFIRDKGKYRAQKIVKL